MFDPFPPAPVLRLDAPRKGIPPRVQADAQHIARLAQADPIAMRHSVGAAIIRLRSLAEADRSFASVIDAL